MYQNEKQTSARQTCLAAMENKSIADTEQRSSPCPEERVKSTGDSEQRSSRRPEEKAKCFGDADLMSSSSPKERTASSSDVDGDNQAESGDSSTSLVQAEEKTESQEDGNVHQTNGSEGPSSMSEQTSPELICVDKDGASTPILSNEFIPGDERLHQHVQVSLQSNVLSADSIQTMEETSGLGPLHFREVKDGRVTQIGECCTVVDIIITPKALCYMEDGGKLKAITKEHEDYQELFKLQWEGDDQIKSQWVLKLKNNILSESQSFLLRILNGLKKDNFQKLCKFVENTYRDYSAKLSLILSDCTEFEFCHADKHSAENMVQHEEDVKLAFQELIHECTGSFPEIDLTVSLQEECYGSLVPSTFTGEMSSLVEEHGTLYELECPNKNRQDETIVDPDADDHSLGFDISVPERQSAEYRLSSLENEVRQQGRQNQTIMDILQNLQKSVEQIVNQTPKEDETEFSVESLALNLASSMAAGQSRLLKKNTGDFSQNTQVEGSKTRIKYSVVTEETLEPSAVDVSREYRDTNSARAMPGHSQTSLTEATTSQQETRPIGVRGTPAAMAQADKTKTQPQSKEEVSITPLQKYREHLQFATPGTPTVSSILEGNAEAGKLFESLSIASFGQGAANNPEVKKLVESVNLALVDEDPVPPRARTVNTVLCLDVSESLKGEGFTQMQRVALDFIDGLELVAEIHGIEENVAVVTVGGRARIAQQLTNDYSRVRYAIDHLTPGGRSPYFEALVVCLAAISGKAGTVDINGVYRIHPRIIFITDGKPTDDKQDTGPDETSTDPNTKMQLVRLMSEFGSRKKHGSVMPSMVWIPVGDCDRSFLQSLATLGSGSVVEEKDIPKLCRYFRIQESIGKIYICVENHTEDFCDIQTAIDAMTMAFIPDMNPEDKQDVITAVKEKLSNKTQDIDPRSYDNVQEDSGLPPLGSRVVRGPDWMWGSQDTNGPGTVLNHNAEEKIIWILWDNGQHNMYRYGNSGCYDVIVVDDQPRCVNSDGVIEIGVAVERGPDWDIGDQDGGPGSIGIVIRKRKDGMIKVRWKSNGSIHTYRFGFDGKFEVTVCDLAELLMKLAAPKDTPVKSDSTCQQRAKEEQHVVNPTQTKIAWHWRDENNQWRIYPEDQNLKLEQAYTRRPAGSCLIQRQGKSHRVLFEKKQEKALNGDVVYDISRNEVTEEEYESLLGIELFFQEIG